MEDTIKKTTKEIIRYKYSNQFYLVEDSGGTKVYYNPIKRVERIQGKVKSDTEDLKYKKIINDKLMKQEKSNG